MVERKKASAENKTFHSLGLQVSPPFQGGETSDESNRENY